MRYIFVQIATESVMRFESGLLILPGYLSTMMPLLRAGLPPGTRYPVTAVSSLRNCELSEMTQRMRFLSPLPSKR
eukprot:232378-Rhodomonas_salina.2